MRGFSSGMMPSWSLEPKKKKGNAATINALDLDLA